VIGIGGFVLLVVVIWLGVELLRWTFRPAARRLRVIKKIGTAEGKSPRVVICTSGTHDYLKDTTGSGRFWSITLSTDRGDPGRDDNRRDEPGGME
jgi:hypothetical protein